MDEFYEYWELIPEFEKYEEVGKVSRCLKFHALIEMSADKTSGPSKINSNLH